MTAIPIASGTQGYATSGGIQAGPLSPSAGSIVVSVKPTTTASTMTPKAETTQRSCSRERVWGDHKQSEAASDCEWHRGAQGAGQRVPPAAAAHCP